MFALSYGVDHKLYKSSKKFISITRGLATCPKVTFIALSYKLKKTTLKQALCYKLKKALK